MKTLPLSVAMSGLHYRELRSHLYPGDGKEAVALALCGRSTNQRRESLLVRELVLIPHAACWGRSPGRVSWPTELAVPALTHAMNEGMAVIKIHSHPTGYPTFSETDDESDIALYNSIFGWLDSEAPLASLIMLPDGSLFGRAMRLSGIAEELDNVRVAGDEFHFWRRRDDASEIPDYAKRTCQAFGELTYKTLRALRVAVVGCSGTGSVVIEQLARYNVGALLIVDPEAVDERNLNRVLNSTKADADRETLKINVMERGIRAIGLETTVKAHAKHIFDANVIRDIASCDVIFGCVDSVDGRYLLNKIAAYYLIPYIDMGVRIDADGAGNVTHVSGVVHTMQPGGSSLFSRGVYSSEDLTAAFIRRTNATRFEELRKQGEKYIKNVRVDQPAVISVNMQIASTAVNEFIARIIPYRVQPNSDYAIRRIQLSDPAASVDEPDGRPCEQFSRFVGRGDEKPLLGMPWLDDPFDAEDKDA